MCARSVMNTTARTLARTAGATAAISGAKVVSAKITWSPASLAMKAMSSADRRGLMVWQTAPMPEIA